MNTAAGIILKAPSGMALFLKRAPTSDHPGTYSWPGGGVEGDETPEQAAIRETQEETGFTPKEGFSSVDQQADDETDFTTFHQDVDEHFIPELNEEHTGFAWAPLSDPPQPLHPGVAATLDRLSSQLAQDRALSLAFDKTVRAIDANGWLHVGVSNISKANVCPYLGKEIPNSVMLGLDPDKIYMLYRDPIELEKSAPTFNNLPILDQHVEISSDDFDKERMIGSLGTDAEFVAPYMRNSSVFYDGGYIDSINNDEIKELSSAYRYRADMTPGVVKGVPFDGVMRDIIGNHVALVKEGRAGSDVVVGDSNEELNMSKTALSMKAAMARGALIAFLQPKLAADAKLPLTTILSGVNAKNFKAKMPSVIEAINKAIGPKLAKDEGEGLKTLLSALEGAPVVDELDPLADVSIDKDPAAIVDPDPAPVPVEETPADPMEAVLAFLTGKLSPEDIAQVQQLCGAGGSAQDEPPPFVGMPKVGGTEKKENDVTAKDDDKVSKEEMGKAMDQAVKIATDSVRKAAKETRDAEMFVKPWVGELAMAHDNASDVLRTALGALGVEGIDDVKEVSGLKAILSAQPKPGAKTVTKINIAADSARTKSYEERFPSASRIKNL